MNCAVFWSVLSLGLVFEKIGDSGKLGEVLPEF